MTAEHPIKVPRKLIEVALPLDAINDTSAAEKKIRQGHPSSLHLWWARRPLAAARAILFAQTVNDPGFQRGMGFKYGANKKEATKERKRLFDLIEELIAWEGTDNQEILQRAHNEILRSWREICDLNRDHPNASELFDPEKIPAVHDPFAGGGAIPLEAQRLGFDVYASDLNPVPVLINKLMIEVPSRFSGSHPVWPVQSKQKKIVEKTWVGSTGLASDLESAGAWIRDEAEKRIGHLYPKVRVTEKDCQGRPDLSKYEGKELPVISWIWAKTVPSPNPAFSHVEVPLATSFVLSKKKNSEAYVEPVISGDNYEFVVKRGTPPDAAKKGTKSSGSHSPFVCVLSGTPMPFSDIRDAGKSGELGRRLMAIVCEGQKERVYVSPSAEHERIANEAKPDWEPNVDISHWPGRTNVVEYGLTKFSDLFTPRQLVALSTISDLIKEAHEKTRVLAVSCGYGGSTTGFDDDGNGATAYADALSILLTFALGKQADLANVLCGWEPIAQCPRHLFGRQSIPMVWDFAESNPLGSSSGAWSVFIRGIANAFKRAFAWNPQGVGHVEQADAVKQGISRGKIISTDPPYYDNIGYADLSDFFYVWHRRTLKERFPRLFSTLSAPKADELVAQPYRHGSKDAAEAFFMQGMASAMSNIANSAHPAFPVTIYYAFKQSETKKGGGTSSTGWETFLDAVLKSGFSIVGTWPIRTENSSRMIGQGSNALASSVVLVCQRRAISARTVSRREFIRELNHVLPEALDEMVRGVGDERSPVAPVDLSQAIIGPGMAIFSKYEAVLEADGSSMSVKTALQLINRFLAEDDFDSDTQFCLHWFEEHGWDTDAYGAADVLARAKATSVGGLAEAGVIESGGGKVRLLKWTEYPSDWDPKTDHRTPVWEALHHLIRALKQGGESAAGEILNGVASKAEATRQLAYRLYTLCERKGWAEDARAYNELITSWTGIESAAPKVSQQELF